MPADEINALHMASYYVLGPETKLTCINTENDRHTEPKIKQHWRKSGYAFFSAYHIIHAKYHAIKLLATYFKSHAVYD